MLKPCMLAIAFSILTFCPVNARADTVSLSGSVTVSGFFGTLTFRSVVLTRMVEHLVLLATAARLPAYLFRGRST